jgi:phosphatidylglycerol:prolipoprotein diacylglycerol transferase
MQTPDRVAFTVFGLPIMWYGILVALGIASVIFIACMRSKRHGISSDRTLNFALICAVTGIIGARLYYVIFNMELYAEDLTRIFQLREGGLAIHGGLIAGLIALIIMCRFTHERVLNVADLFFAAIPLGQAIGRWGNFFNGEAHGGETSLPWGVIIEGKTYHPTFLYESIWCLLLFAALIIVDNRRSFEGQTFLLYCIGYSVERFFVEGLRTDSLMLFGVLKQAQVLSVVAIIAAGAAYVYLRKRGRRAGGAETAPIETATAEPAVTASTEPDAAEPADAEADSEEKL